MQQPVLNVTEAKTEEMVETGASKRENLTWNNQREPVGGATDYRNLTRETPELKCCFSFFSLSDILDFFRHVTNNSFDIRSFTHTNRFDADSGGGTSRTETKSQRGW